MTHHIRAWAEQYLGLHDPLVFLLTDDKAIVVSGICDLRLWIVSHKDGEYTATMDQTAMRSDNLGVMGRVFDIVSAHYHSGLHALS